MKLAQQDMWARPDNVLMCTTVGHGITTLSGGDVDGDIVFASMNKSLARLVESTEASLERFSGRRSRRPKTPSQSVQSSNGIRPPHVSYVDHRPTVPTLNVRGTATLHAEIAQARKLLRQGQNSVRATASDCRLVCRRALRAESDFQLHTSWEFLSKMAASASTPQIVIIEPGSNGGTEDLFQANADRAMPKTVVALAELARERNANMPVFRWGVDMDVSDAYLWIEHVRMPHLVALSFWFMTNPIDDQRLRVWIYNLCNSQTWL